MLSKNACSAPLQEAIGTAKRIIVVAGAGLSVSCGIPDFRSPEGLYSTMDCAELGLTCPEDIFDIGFLHRQS